jgi:Spy/CpxP family protein refolding chaperone
MNRRQMVVLPGIAFAASQGFSQTTDAVSASSRSAATSHKVLAHYGRMKAFSKIPKTAAKQAKYISFLTTYLSLLPNQQDQTAHIFATASSSEAALKSSMKAARKSLAQSVKSNNTAGITQAAAAIGTLVAQRHTIGANANAAFFQLLTSDQQAKLSQLNS